MKEPDSAALGQAPAVTGTCPLCGSPASDRDRLTGQLRQMLTQALDADLMRNLLKQALDQPAQRALGLSQLQPGVKLSVVVPVYNERNTIRTILDRIMAVPIRKEIIVVDDCSTDGTREVLEQIDREQSGDEPAPAPRSDEKAQGCEQQQPTPTAAGPGKTEPLNNLRFFYHQRNQGKGAALRTGFAQVTGSIVVVQDADLEYNPAEYPRLIEPIVDGRADVVYGSRFIGETHRVLYFWHYLGNKLLTTISNMFTDLNLTDMETCYKVFRREVIDEIGPTLKSNRFGFEPEITAKIAKRGLRVYELPISYSGREYAEGKKITWRDALSALWWIIRFRFRD